MYNQPKLAIIGGSGFYQMPGLEDIIVENISTPFGSPSAPVVIGTLEGTRVAFLARHGEGHGIMPSEINYRANIYGLKSIGVEQIVSVSACGSLRDDYAPGQIVIPDQLFDFTRGRQNTFFGNGIVAHISVAEPFCADLSQKLIRALEPTVAEEIPEVLSSGIGEGTISTTSPSFTNEIFEAPEVEPVIMADVPAEPATADTFDPVESEPINELTIVQEQSNSVVFPSWAVFVTMSMLALVSFIIYRRRKD